MEAGTSGVVRGPGMEVPKNNFALDLVAFVEIKGSTGGFLAQVCRELDKTQRYTVNANILSTHKHPLKLTCIIICTVQCVCVCVCVCVCGVWYKVFCSDL